MKINIEENSVLIYSFGSVDDGSGFQYECTADEYQELCGLAYKAEKYQSMLGEILRRNSPMSDLSYTIDSVKKHASEIASEH